MSATLLALLVLRQESLAVSRNLIALEKSRTIEVLLPPTMEEEGIVLNDPKKLLPATIRRVVTRGDPAFAPIVKAMVASYSPKARKQNKLCGFMTDVLVRPEGGDQFAFCFTCRDGLVLGRPEGDALYKVGAAILGSWHLRGTPEIAKALTTIFPDEIFPRKSRLRWTKSSG